MGVRSNLKLWLLGSVAFIAVLIGWSACTYTRFVPDFFLPTPSEFLRALWHLFVVQHFLNDILISTTRVMAGFLIATVLAVPLGIMLGLNKKVEAFFEPIIDFIRYTPTPALIPLFILWFGIGEEQKVIVIAQAVFFQLVLLVANSVSFTPKELIESARTLGASRWQIVTQVVFPWAKPKIYDDLRISIGWAWSVLMAAEIVGATSGIGLVIIQSQRLLRTPNVIAAIIVIGTIGLATDIIIKRLYPYFFPWAPKLKTHA